MNGFNMGLYFITDRSELNSDCLLYDTKHIKNLLSRLYCGIGCKYWSMKMWVYVLLLVIMGVDAVWMLLLAANDVIVKELFDYDASMWSITVHR